MIKTFSLFVHRIADDYERHSKEALSDPEKHLANPVNAFLLVKRFTTDWEDVIEKLIRGNASQSKSMLIWMTYSFEKLTF